MNLQIRKALLSDAAGVGYLYDAVCDDLEGSVNYPGWKKGIYPTIMDAEKAISEGTLYIAETENKIAGTVILSHTPEQAYEQAHWKKDLSYDDVYVIYTLAVHPDYAGSGVASALLQFAQQLAKKQGMKSLRLDVTEKNIPAIRLYEKQGFEYIDTVDLGLGDIGLKWFRLYEKLVK